MELNGILYNGKAETGASCLAAASGINPVETFEEMLQMLFRNTRTVIRKLEDPVVSITVSGH